MSGEIVKKQKGPMATIQGLLVSQRAQIEMALPRHMSTDRLIRVSMTALRRTPKLLECTTTSLLGAIISAAQLGLETDGALGHAYLVPFKKECQLVIGYRGMIDLARRSGQILSISARIVYENDKFEYSYGLDEKLDHIPAMDGRGSPIAAYAVARIVGGGYQIEVLSMEQLRKAQQASSASYKGCPWEAYWDEMARKTAVRRLFKYLPVSVELQRAVGLDDLAESGQPQYLDIGLAEEPQPETKVEILRERLTTPTPPPEPAVEVETEQPSNPTPEETAINAIELMWEAAEAKFGTKESQPAVAALCTKHVIKSINDKTAQRLIDIINSMED